MIVVINFNYTITSLNVIFFVYNMCFDFVFKVFGYSWNDRIPYVT